MYGVRPKLRIRSFSRIQATLQKIMLFENNQPRKDCPIYLLSSTWTIFIEKILGSSRSRSCRLSGNNSIACLTWGHSVCQMLSHLFYITHLCSQGNASYLVFVESQTTLILLKSKCKKNWKTWKYAFFLHPLYDK